MKLRAGWIIGFYIGMIALTGGKWLYLLTGSILIAAVAIAVAAVLCLCFGSLVENRR